MKAEHLAIEESKKTWGTGPFVTVDAVVRAAGKVLLVKRANAPGRGLWAVPGGFLESRESVLQGAMRELSEETGLSLTEASLESALKGVAVFDHPDRSLRGRTITHAHFFDLKDIALPPIAAADDAAEARWEAIEALKDMEARFFEDHFHILDHFLSLTG
jgi:bifunctional NMN adenylyltransferase/nudix hydrolase